MPREHGSSRPEGLTTSEEGWAGAHAEKPLRDAARPPDERSGVKITDEEKKVLDKVAEKYGGAAVTKFRAERELREKAPHKLLLNQIRELEKKWKKEKHRKQDLEIITELEQRLNVYVQLLIDKGREQQPAELAHMYGRLPVTYKVGEKGGAIFRGYGLGEKLFSGNDINDEEMESESVKQRIKTLRQAGKEFINYSFTPEGEREFYRSLGILREDQEAADLPGKRESLLKHQKYSARLKTNIEGVEVLAIDDPERATDKQAEKGIYLLFSPKFIEKLTSEH